MKRNLVLLTAVVLAAIVLSGCVMWPFGVAVKYDLEKDVFVAHKNDKRISKNTVDFVAEFKFAEEDEGLTYENFEIKAFDKDNKDLEPVPANLLEEEEVVGIKVTIPAAGEKDFTISIKVPAAS